MKRLAAIGILALMVGCGGEEASNNDHDHEHQNHENHDANNASDVDVYADGLMKMGHNENFHVMLMGADPAPPDVGDNVWTIRVMDTDDNPVDGAKVTVTPFMPAHGHGTSPADFTGTFTENGTYEVGPMDLFMPGKWETTVKVEGESEDMVTFTFMLEG